MLPRPTSQSTTVPATQDLTRDDIDTMQASFREIAARGGETGEIANRMLRASLELDTMTAEVDAFLSRYRR